VCGEILRPDAAIVDERLEGVEPPVVAEELRQKPVGSVEAGGPDPLGGERFGQRWALRQADGRFVREHRRRPQHARERKRGPVPTGERVLEGDPSLAELCQHRSGRLVDRVRTERVDRDQHHPVDWTSTVSGGALLGLPSGGRSHVICRATVYE
jgi:hypothetical protein